MNSVRSVVVMKVCVFSSMASKYSLSVRIQFAQHVIQQQDGHLS